MVRMKTTNVIETINRTKLAKRSRKLIQSIDVKNVHIKINKKLSYS